MEVLRCVHVCGAVSPGMSGYGRDAAIQGGAPQWCSLCGRWALGHGKYRNLHNSSKKPGTELECVPVEHCTSLKTTLLMYVVYVARVTTT